jgi:hypothetical protein
MMEGISDGAGKGKEFPAQERAMDEEQQKARTLEYGVEKKVRPLPTAVASATFGLLSIPAMAFMFIGAITALAAIWMGSSALADIRRDPQLTGKTSALVGIISGGVALLLGGICAVVMYGP